MCPVAWETPLSGLCPPYPPPRENRVYSAPTLPRGSTARSDETEPSQRHKHSQDGPERRAVPERTE